LQGARAVSSCSAMDGEIMSDEPDDLSETIRLDWESHRDVRMHDLSDDDLALLAKITDALRGSVSPAALRTRLRRLVRERSPLKVKDARIRIAALSSFLTESGVRRLSVFDHDVNGVHMLVEMIDDRSVSLFDLGDWEEPLGAVLDCDCMVWTLTSLKPELRGNAQANAVLLWARKEMPDG
jgi:hypothetical protein